MQLAESLPWLPPIPILILMACPRTVGRRNNGYSTVPNQGNATPHTAQGQWTHASPGERPASRLSGRNRNMDEEAVEVAPPKKRMRPQSCKSKGRRFQQQIAASITQRFPALTSDDVWSTSMGCGG